MSGDSEVPPTYYFSGITFNPDFYQSSGDYLTLATAKSNFLTYPTAQGEETISTLNTSTLTTTSILTPKIDSTTSDTNMFIASNVSTADITIAGSQTSGVLNIGTGARTTPAADSAINIGTSAAGATRVNIGTELYTDINFSRYINGCSV